MSETTYNNNWEKEEVLNLGGEYFEDLIQQLEEKGIKVYDAVKNITARVEACLPITNKQAAVLIRFKEGFRF